MIELTRLKKEFRKSGALLPVLDGIDLSVGKGEWLTVTGKSGAGKSTLLYAIAGLLRPTSGSVTVNGADLFALSREARARFRGENIGIIFQSFHLFPQLTVLQNVLVSGGRLHSRTDAAEALLDRMGLLARKAHYPAELSVGEKQRTALARAVFCKPACLLADEPTGNLDQENGRVVMETLKSFNREGATIIFVTHKPVKECEPFSNRILSLDHGKLQTL
jgi:putative ABC transport system ATP-binding protein